MKNIKAKTAEEHVKAIVKPIFDKVLQETSANRVSVGGSAKKKVNYFYCPHAWSSWFKFSKKDFYLKPKQNTEVSTNNHTSVIPETNKNGEPVYKNFMDCTIIVQKEQIRINNNINHKKVFVIDKSKNIEKQFKEIVKLKDNETKNVLKEFIKIYGGYSDFIIRNRTSEDKVWGDEVIKAIPREWRFRNEVGKKVYNKEVPVFEFKSPILASNHLTNSAINELAPLIAQAIYTLNPLRFLMANVKSIDDLFQWEGHIKALTPSEKDELTNWIFKELGTEFIIGE